MGSSPRRAVFLGRAVAIAAAFVAVSGIAIACAGGGGSGTVVPRAGLSYGTVPILQGEQVMVAPIQLRQGVPAGLQPDAELQAALEGRAGTVDWIMPDELRRVLSRNPAIDIPLDRLRTEVFLQAVVERVGDPLFGQLRRLNAITGVPLILIPVRLRYRPRPETVEDRILEPAMELAAALLHVQSGRVVWFGIVDGAPGSAEDPGTLASATEALARSLVP